MILFDILTPNDQENDKSGRTNTSITVPLTSFSTNEVKEIAKVYKQLTDTDFTLNQFN